MTDGMDIASDRDVIGQRDPDAQTNGANAAAALVRLVDGGTFVFEAGADVPAIWGHRQMVAWSSGEPLLIVGPQGVGKTTLAQRIILARMGFAPAVLGLDVEPDPRPTLYLACDRPKQAQRSMVRMVDESDRARLDKSLKVWKGPLDFDLKATPAKLVAWAQELGAGTVVIDSLKDVASDLSEEKTGYAINRALQDLVAVGIEAIGLHHQRKAQADNKKPSKLADVYGSGWITAGCGSVLLLWGEPGDVLVELSHLKQPAEEIGPWTIAHDHETGEVAVHDAADVRSLLGLNLEGVTAKDAAATVHGTASPSKAQVEKIRRRLEKLVGEGVARRLDPKAAGDPARYVERGEW